ncbi:unnamed protein product [Echinostoma caproni]|uniref:Uncharacterized protein n=1 Tax=Echinostoma caproni TaxID=27848 RepID=A0A3P8FI94_9TREM|nr:unnamed protein product [Echinostoma caproni]
MISRVFKELKNYKQIYSTGFITEEVRESPDRRSRRIGFDVILLDNPTRRSPLARCADCMVSPVPRNWPRVGQYVVNVQSFEQLAVPCIQSVLDKLNASENATGSTGIHTICVIDEIGKMELLCPVFSDCLGKLLARINEMNGVVLLATVPAPRGSGDSRRGIRLVDELCAYPQARMFEALLMFVQGPNESLSKVTTLRPLGTQTSKIGLLFVNNVTGGFHLFLSLNLYRLQNLVQKVCYEFRSLPVMSQPFVATNFAL